jgi:Zn-dependent protease
MIAQRLLIVIMSLIAVKYVQAQAAYKLGDPTPKASGRLSLNPILHIDVFTTLLLPLLVLIISSGTIIIGYAKQLPLNPYHLKNLRKSMRIIGILPSITHGAIAFCFSLLLTLNIPFLNELFLFGIWANVMLAVLNLVPIPPLEGAKVMASFLPGRLSHTYLKLRPYGFFILGLFFFLNILPLGMRSITSFIVNHVFQAPIAI